MDVTLKAAVERREVQATKHLILLLPCHVKYFLPPT